MITSYDVYKLYRQLKSNNPKIPSENVYRKRLSLKSLLNIDRLSQYFNTIYSNVNPELYLKYGFSLWKTFNYAKFLDNRILEKYQQQDKIIKRSIKVSKDDIDTSFNYINIPLYRYCKKYDNNQKLIITDYIFNRINSVIIMYCIKNKYIDFSDIETEMLYHIFNNYDDWMKLMYKNYKYIELLDNKQKDIYEKEHETILR